MSLLIVIFSIMLVHHVHNKLATYPYNFCMHVFVKKINPDTCGVCHYSHIFLLVVAVAVVGEAVVVVNKYVPSETLVIWFLLVLNHGCV